jgi:hypothetical protein
MANGDPVTQKQFFDTMSQTKTDILDAVEKTNGNVQANAVSLATVHTKHEGLDKRVEKVEAVVENQKIWNRGLAAVEAIIAGVLAYLGFTRGS